MQGVAAACPVRVRTPITVHPIDATLGHYGQPQPRTTVLICSLPVIF